MQYYKDDKGNFYVMLEDGVVAKVEKANVSNMTKVDKTEFLHVHYGIRQAFTEQCEFKCVLDADWHLKDSLIVPCGDKKYEFVVEHVVDCGNHKDVYFVSKDIVGVSNMLEMEKFLDDLQSKMPSELVAVMKTIEHKSKNGFTMSRKLNILSYGNVCGDTNCSGKDDMLFDGLKTEAERTKNFKGETEWYWLATMWDGERSPSLSSSAYVMRVSNNGYMGYSTSATGTGGVVPGFSLSIKNCDSYEF